MIEWWEWLTVGFLLAAAGLYLAKRAVDSAARWARGRGCDKDSRGCGASGPGPGAAGPLELVQLNVELQHSRQAGK